MVWKRALFFDAHGNSSVYITTYMSKKRSRTIRFGIKYGLNMFSSLLFFFCGGVILGNQTTQPTLYYTQKQYPCTYGKYSMRHRQYKVE